MHGRSRLDSKGAWLTENDVHGGIYDLSDLKLLGAARVRLRRVNLPDQDVGEVDEEQEAEGRGPVNVLVAVPGLTTTIEVYENKAKDRKAKLEYLVSKPRHSRTDPHWWMTAVSSFPPYQSIPFRDSERAPKRRKLDVNVGVASMHAHFANLVDEGIADVDVLPGGLRYRDTSNTWSPICQFPAIEKDVLLYLALLGGKKFSAYYRYYNQETTSTLGVFEEFRERNGNREESNALRRDFTKFINFENVVARASRRNGLERWFGWCVSGRILPTKRI